MPRQFAGQIRRAAGGCKSKERHCSRPNHSPFRDTRIPPRRKLPVGIVAGILL